MKLRHLLDIIRMHCVSSDEIEIALATIVKVTGSAYLREGAKMIVTRNGKTDGILSPGCLEEDLRARVDEVFLTGKPQIYTYNTNSEDDLLWGTGTGCNGEIDIFVEPISWETVPLGSDRPILPLLSDLLDNRHEIAAVKCIQGAPLSAMLLVTDYGQTFGGLGDSELEENIGRTAKELLQHGERSLLIQIPEQDSVFFIERYVPVDRLFVFGAGADAEPLVELAGRLGFHITLIDPRDTRCIKEQFSSAHEFIVSHPDKAFQQLDIDHRDFVVVMTHHFERDREILTELTRMKPYYLGVLGPSRRTKLLLDSDQIPDFIRSPVGLSIGAIGPEEIAVSIMAEMIEARRKRGTGR